MSNKTQVRSWRAGPSVDENSPVTRWTGIILLAGILIGAIAVFLYVIPPPPREEMFFSALMVESYDNFIPPLRGTPGDVENLKRPDVEDRLPYSWVDVRELQSEKTISEIRPELKEALKSSEQHDVVFIYVAAHGIGRDNQAYLLGSDYTGEGDEGLCNVTEVLDAVKELPCKTKVVFFDCGHLNSDARLGVLVNSFPYCLQQQMEQLDDDTVWAISSTQLLQVSNFTSREFNFKSVFGQAVLSGIDRQSDSTGGDDFDDKLTLAELYEYIARYCYTQTKSNPQLLQTPVLLQGSKAIGTMEDAQKITLGRFAPRADDEAEESNGESGDGDPEGPADAGEGEKTAQSTPSRNFRSQRRPVRPMGSALAMALTSNWSPSALAWQDPNPPTDDSAADKRPATDSTDSPDKAANGEEAPAADGDEKQPAEENGGATPPPNDAGTTPDEPKAVPTWDGPPQLETMFKIWLLRDKLQGREIGSHGWSPIDFAPHIWRALNFRLVQLDRDLRMGSTERQEEVTRIHDRLQALATAMGSNRTVPRLSEKAETADARILAAWNSFVNSADKIDWDRANARHDATKQRIRKYCDVYYRALDYARWYERASVGQSSLSPSDINKLFVDLKANSALFSVTQFPANSKVGTLAELQPMEIAAEELDISDLKLLDMIGARLDYGAPRESSFLAGAFSDTETISRDFRIEVMLDSPLLTAEARKYAYKSPGKEIDITLNRGDDISKVRSQPENQGDPVAWTRARSRLALFQSLLALVNVETEFSAPNASADTKDKNKFYEDAGKVIRDHLRDLRSATRDSRIDTWRTVALLDPRDLNAEDRNVISILPVQLIPPKEETILALDVERKLELVAANRSLPVAVTVKASNPAPQTEDLILELSQADTTEVDLFEFFSIEYDGKRLTKDAVINIPFKNLQRLEFQVQTEHHRATENGSAPFYLIFKVKDVNGSQTEGEIQLVPPLPNFVELFARHSEVAELNRNRSADQPEFGNVITLRPFPIETHKNDYIFWLANRSGQAKKVQVKLYRVQRPPQLVLPPGRVTYYKTQQIPGSLIRHMKKRIDDGLVEPIAEANMTIGAATEATANYENVRDLQNVASVSRLQLGAVAPPKPSDPSEPAPKPPAPEAVDSQNGLLCVITEVEGESNAATDSWWKWIEVRPRNPASYIEIPTATYDPLEGRIEVTVKAKVGADGSPVIDWGEIIEGVPVRWEVDNAQAMFQSSGLKQMLTATQQSVTLFGVLNGKPGPEDVRMVTIPLSVDGYPRTFTLEIKCTGAGEQKSVDVTPKRKLVRLDDPQFLDYAGKPLDEKAVLLFPPDKPRSAQSLTLKSCKSIVVSPRIDAPQNSFQYLLPKAGEEVIVDRIEAYLAIGNERQQVKMSYADRTFHNMVIHYKGGLRINSSVADPRFIFDAEGLQDTALDVVTVMHVNGEKIESRKALLLDSRPPTAGEIQTTAATKSVEKGSPLTLFLETKDTGTDVANVVFAFNDAAIPNQTYDPTEMSVGTATRVSPTKWSVTIPTKDLPAGSSHRVVARSTDVLGTNYDFHKSFLFTVVPSANAPEMQKKKRFTLIVKLVNPDGSEFPYSAKTKVNIKGVAQPPVNKGTSFQVSGLPARTYEISAFYVTKLKSEYRGLRELEIPPETSDEKPVVVSVIMMKKPK